MTQSALTCPVFEVAQAQHLGGGADSARRHGRVLSAAGADVLGVVAAPGRRRSRHPRCSWRVMEYLQPAFS
jgi:hypothetical protein